MVKKLLDSAKISTTDAIKAASKRAIQKTAEATGDFIGNKIADKMASVSRKKSVTELHFKQLPNDEAKEDVEIATRRKRYISPKKDNKLLKN